jgi:multidrug resistance efflux pump
VRADVVQIAADVPGLISDVFVHDNEKVSKGQQLFQIDKRRLRSIKRQPMSRAIRPISIRPNAISCAARA